MLPRFGCGMPSLLVRPFSALFFPSHRDSLSDSAPCSVSQKLRFPIIAIFSALRSHDADCDPASHPRPLFSFCRSQNLQGVSIRRSSSDAGFFCCRRPSIAVISILELSVSFPLSLKKKTPFIRYLEGCRSFVFPSCKPEFAGFAWPRRPRLPFSR